MSGYEAWLYDEPKFFDRNVVTLAVREQRYGGTASYLLSNGTWQTVAEGEQIVDMGIVLPRASIEAIAVAIQGWQGHTSHADTEARVLREWLAVERDRVDRALIR